MTFRKQWPQKRTEYPTSNRGKSQKQYFAAKTTADRAHATTRGRQSPTTRSYSYRPLGRYAPTTARSRAPRAPRPSDPRGPARPRPRRPGRCPPSLVPWPAARRDPPGRARQGGRRPPKRAVRHHHPDTLLNAADPGRGRAAEKPGEPRPRQSCARVYGGVVECGARRGRAGHPATNKRRVDCSPAQAC